MNLSYHMNVEKVFNYKILMIRMNIKNKQLYLYGLNMNVSLASNFLIHAVKPMATLK